jgi:hypothetical protein
MNSLSVDENMANLDWLSTNVNISKLILIFDVMLFFYVLTARQGVESFMFYLRPFICTTCTEDIKKQHYIKN